LIFLTSYQSSTWIKRKLNAPFAPQSYLVLTIPPFKRAPGLLLREFITNLPKASRLGTTKFNLGMADRKEAKKRQDDVTTPDGPLEPVAEIRRPLDSIKKLPKRPDPSSPAIFAS
jgi:hypothetical protein